MSDRRARGLDRHVHVVKPEDVFGPSNGPLEQRAREMARATIYSFEEIRLAIFAVNVRRREIELPEIPREDWIDLMRPGAGLAATMGCSLVSAYQSVTQACGEAWAPIAEPNPPSLAERHLALSEPDSERASVASGGTADPWRGLRKLVRNPPQSVTPITIIMAVNLSY